MPPWNEWHDWGHAMFSAYGHWIPGDARGFRDHGHRIHSSGDYKRPPPPDEHAGLRRYAQRRTGRPTVLPPEVRPVLADALADKFLEMKTPPRIVGVGAQHVHALVRVGDQDARPLVGRAKQYASLQVRWVLPGSIWAEGCHPVRIRDEAHYRNVVLYIERHRDEGAAVWVHPRVRGRGDA